MRNLTHVHANFGVLQLAGRPLSVHLSGSASATPSDQARNLLAVLRPQCLLLRQWSERAAAGCRAGLVTAILQVVHLPGVYY